MSDAEDGSDEGSESEEGTCISSVGIMLNHFFVLLPATYNRVICLCVGSTRKKEAN